MGDRPATECEVDEKEIGITPEMIEAGAGVLFGFETVTCGEEYWARKVYVAMEGAKLPKARV